MKKIAPYVGIFVLGFVVCAATIYYFYGPPSCFTAMRGGSVSHAGLGIVGVGGKNPVEQAARVVSRYVVNIDSTGQAVTVPADPFGFFFGPPEPAKWQGSGVIFTPDGYIVTNNHVVQDAATITVTLYGGKQYAARLIGRDPRTDLAVIKIPATGLPFATFADSNTAQVGDWVIAVGSPLGLEWTVTVGVISATGRRLGGLMPERLLQTDASINPGNSGGALADLNGQVVGINCLIKSPSGGSVGLGFAIPSNVARKVANDLKARGRVSHAWLGVVYEPLNAFRESPEARGMPVVGGNGVYIRHVYPGSPAAKAGLRTGDVIRKINGKIVSPDATPKPGTVALVDVMEKLHVGDVVELEVWHVATGQTSTVRVRLAEMPLDLAQPQAEPQSQPFLP